MKGGDIFAFEKRSLSETLHFFHFALTLTE